jgi:hypothetical protein
MAGEWIPWVKGLTKRREVLQIASTLSITRREAACCCMEVWEWCDDEGEWDVSRNCHVYVTGLSFLDELVGVTGFGQAMHSAGWVVNGEASQIVFPNLGQYVGKSAKERLLARRRKQDERLRHDDVTEMSRKKSRSKRDKNVTPSCSCSCFSELGISIPSCLDTEAFREAWDNWEQVRREMKKPLTPTAAKLRLKDCEKMGHDAAVAGLTNSASHQWQDIFVPESFKPKTQRIMTPEEAEGWSFE